MAARSAAGPAVRSGDGWQIQFTAIAFALTIAQAALVTYAFERPLLRMPPERWKRVLPVAWRHARKADLRSSKRA